MNSQVLEVARRIKELREIVEMTVEQVAEELNLSADEYSKYENGELDIPISVIYGVANVLGVDSTVLLLSLIHIWGKRCMGILRLDRY